MHGRDRAVKRIEREQHGSQDLLRLPAGQTSPAGAAEEAHKNQSMPASFGLE